MRLPVLFVSFNPADPMCRGFWDHGLIEDMIAGEQWPWDDMEPVIHESPGDQPSPPVDHGLVIIPGRQNVGHVGEVAEYVQRMKWALVLITGDEERQFPAERLASDTVDVMRMSSLVGPSYPIGYAAGTRQLVVEREASDHYEVAFAGQVTNPRRDQFVEAMRRLRLDDARTLVVGSDRFGGGYAREDYMRVLCRATIAPCPAGPVSVDTFRFYEALEAGCVPIIDLIAGDGSMQADLWRAMFGRLPPVPVAVSWEDDLQSLVRMVMRGPNEWRALSSSWWQMEKRRLARSIEDLLRRRLRGDQYERPPTTAVITASPSPRHPDGEMLRLTIESVRQRFPSADLIVAFDGVRPEQEHLRDAYLEHVVDVCRWANGRGTRVAPFFTGAWGHQALTFKRALEHVRTRHVLFVEQDTPLVGELDERKLTAALDSGEVDSIRFHHEAGVHPEHAHLSIGLPRMVGGVRLQQTAQWSQRPHLARTSWYERIMSTFFGEASRTMIEDTMHGVCENALRVHGPAGLEPYRLFLYAPERGSWVRSTHTDGRGDEPKFDMIYEYDSDDVPPGAPHPTSKRNA